MAGTCSVSWCEEGDHLVTPHKRLVGQWHTVSLDSAGDVQHEITMQLEVWARYTIPDYIRSALTMVNSETLDQITCEISAEQARDIAHRFEGAAIELSIFDSI